MFPKAPGTGFRIVQAFFILALAAVFFAFIDFSDSLPNNSGSVRALVLPSCCVRHSRDSLSHPCRTLPAENGERLVLVVVNHPRTTALASPPSAQRTFLTPPVCGIKSPASGFAAINQTSSARSDSAISRSASLRKELFPRPLSADAAPFSMRGLHIDHKTCRTTIWGNGIAMRVLRWPRLAIPSRVCWQATRRYRAET
jgi:hypothetical protein